MGNFCVQGCKNLKDKFSLKKEETSGEKKDEKETVANSPENQKNVDSDSSSSESDSEDSKKENKESKKRKKNKKGQKNPENMLSVPETKSKKEEHND